MTTTELRLREFREARGWTQQDVAEQIARLAWVRQGEHVGVNADMVSKWERGVKQVSRRYRELLSVLYDTDAHTLGIGPAGQVVSRPGADAGDGSLTGMLGGAESLMDQLGTAGALLRPRMFGMWKDDAMQRRALLKLIGLASVTGVAGLPGANAPRAEVKATPETVQDLEDLAGRYQALYVSTASAILVPAVTAHLEVVRDLLREGSAAPLRRRLLANQAWVGGLAGRLAFFDSGDPVGGRGYFSLARESARAAGDHLQGAVTLYGMSRIAEEDRRFDAALDYLHAAHSMTSKRPDNRVTSYLCGNEARIQAEAGNHAVALAAIDRARDLFAEPVTDAGLPWLDWDNDAARLSHRHGQVTLFAGRLDESQAALTDALNLLPRDAVKQRTRILIDTAGVHRDRGDLDEACRIAGDAAEDLGRVWGAVRFHRLRDFRASVQQWSGSAPVRQLDERLAAVA